MGTLEGIDNSPSIGKLPVLLLQFLIFPRNQGCFLDLINLKFQKSHLPVLLLLVHIKGFQLCLALPVFLIGCLHLFFFRENPLTAVGIQNLQLLLLVKKGLVLMLSVNVKKTCRCSLHLAYRTCLPIYLIDAPAVHDLPGHQYLSVLRVNIQCGKRLLCFRILHLEQKLPQRIGSIFPDHASGCLSSQDQLHGTKKNGLTSTGLTSEDIKSRPEFHFNFIYECKVFYV